MKTVTRQRMKKKIPRSERCWLRTQLRSKKSASHHRIHGQPRRDFRSMVCVERRRRKSRFELQLQRDQADLKRKRIKCRFFSLQRLLQTFDARRLLTASPHWGVTEAEEFMVAATRVFSFCCVNACISGLLLRLSLRLSWAASTI